MAKKFEVKRAERRIELCLDGSLVAEFEAVEADLEDARRLVLADRRLSGSSKVKELEKRQAELYKEQEESTLVLTLRALPRAEWAKIKEANPPRKGNALDSDYGINIDDAPQAALLAAGTIVSAEQLGEPIEFTAEDWESISPDLSDGQWREVKAAVISVNQGNARVPFSQSGFKLMQDSAENSK